MIILSEVIQNASGMAFEEFANHFLFDPLNIEQASWDYYKHGQLDAAGGLNITSRDMLKIGVTFLQQGEWNDQEIINRSWVETAQTNYRNNSNIKVAGEDARRSGYGYAWWTKKVIYNSQKIDSYYAGGWGGQNIIIIPGLETVVVFTGGNYTSRPPVFEILERFILPAMA